MARFALIDGNNVVQNIIEWDAETPYVPAEGWTISEILDQTIGLGDTLVNPVDVPAIPPDDLA